MNLSVNKVLKLWFSLDQRVRFILVGGYNTVLAYAIFCMLEIFLQEDLYYLWVLCIAHFISVFNSFVNLRFFVFRSQGLFVHEYIKTNLVYLAYLALNSLLLYILKDIVHIEIFRSQIICVIILNVLFYFVHKNFSFKT